ncbi:conserved hypothetical protein [Streptomyces himastatinicus ATCC 53653]|uniref:Secreted protein n=1 Tax=Streptomyces himastatinicus ATCC 53653 TaxID=457427 RepID=D9WA28_9ACTN|nr:hypothetical protein [Streptomyces himastatinicus]EFL24824.1 conserved hypothetical protein [Streptomyces himastatinicus ATCC 53653]
MRPAGMRKGRTTGRRGTAIASSAAALCLGALLSGCAGGGEGHVATGAAGPGDGRAPTKAVPPDGGVDLVPLDQDDDPGARGRTDGKGGPGGSPGTAGTDEASGASPTTGPTTGSGAETGTPAPSASSRPQATGSPDADDPGGGSDPGGGRTNGEPVPSSPPGTTSPSPSAPGKPAALKVGDPERTATDERWCEKVSVEFRNTGGLPVVSGTVTLSTHVIDALGLDWATLESKRKLPAPIGAGQKRTRSWKVCVDAWRVPLGMHIETRDVSVDWKPWKPPKPRESGTPEVS